MIIFRVWKNPHPIPRNGHPILTVINVPELVGSGLIDMNGILSANAA